MDRDGSPVRMDGFVELSTRRRAGVRLNEVVSLQRLGGTNCVRVRTTKHGGQRQETLADTLIIRNQEGVTHSYYLWYLLDTQEAQGCELILQ